MWIFVLFLSYFSQRRVSITLAKYVGSTCSAWVRRLLEIIALFQLRLKLRTGDLTQTIICNLRSCRASTKSEKASSLPGSNQRNAQHLRWQIANEGRLFLSLMFVIKNFLPLDLKIFCHLRMQTTPKWMCRMTQILKESPVTPPPDAESQWCCNCLKPRTNHDKLFTFIIVWHQLMMLVIPFDIYVLELQEGPK